MQEIFSYCTTVQVLGLGKMLEKYSLIWQSVSRNIFDVYIQMSYLLFKPIEIVAQKLKNKGEKKTKTNTRGMLQVKGLDIGDDDDFNGSNKNFGLRPSVDQKQMKKKKKLCTIL